MLDGKTFYNNVIPHSTFTTKSVKIVKLVSCYYYKQWLRMLLVTSVFGNGWPNEMCQPLTQPWWISDQNISADPEINNPKYIYGNGCVQCMQECGQFLVMESIG